MVPRDRPPALVGWRLMALVYDVFPLLALWFLAAAIFTLAHGDAVRGGLWGALEFVAFIAIAGVYATLSWKHGGQTIGMRPWRLQVTTHALGEPTTTALWLRFGIGCLSFATAGLGFWWAWIDRDHLTWHDRASGTRMIRTAKATSAQQAQSTGSGIHGKEN